MALYDDGKTRFDDKFIEQFSPSIQQYLRIKRYNLVDSTRSKYCTIENWLYNCDIDHIEEELFWFIIGFQQTTAKTWIKNFVGCVHEIRLFIDELERIYQQMKEENNWG